MLNTKSADSKWDFVIGSTKTLFRPLTIVIVGRLISRIALCKLLGKERQECSRWPKQAEHMVVSINTCSKQDRWTENILRKCPVHSNHVSRILNAERLTPGQIKMRWKRCVPSRFSAGRTTGALGSAPRIASAYAGSSKYLLYRTSQHISLEPPAILACCRPKYPS